MFKIDSDDKTTIKCTRGDRGSIIIRKKDKDGTYENFCEDDQVIMSIKNNFSDSDVLLRKVVTVDNNNLESVLFEFTKEDTTIGELIGKPKKFQYDISVNEDITILGYDEMGPKYFVIYPEGSNDL